MNKSRELKAISAIVKRLLQTVPETRNSDDLLYFKVCEQIDPVSINLPFKEVVLNRKRIGYPARKSVERAGRKLRAAFPELAGCDKVEEQRLLNEEAFLDYARSVRL